VARVRVAEDRLPQVRLLFLMDLDPSGHLAAWLLARCRRAGLHAMPRHRQRLPWALRLVLALFVLLAVVWVGVWLVASPLVERRIEALLERRFAADVSFGSFSF